MRIGIFGIGAIGSLLTYRIARTGVSPYLFSRGETIPALFDRGIIVHSSDSVDLLEPTEYNMLEHDSPLLDVVIICCKSGINNLDHLTQLANSHLAHDGIIVGIQNGLSHLELIARLYDRYRIIGACITHGASRIGPAEIRLGGEGRIVIGPLDIFGKPLRENLFEDFIEILDKAGLYPEPVSEIMPHVWEKVLINLAINPITAICGVNNGALGSGPLHELAVSVLMEGATVAQHEGFEIDIEKMQKTLEEVIENTSENQSSMLQDIAQGKSTEIFEIAGIIVRNAEKHGIPVPITNALYVLVTALELL